MNYELKKWQPDYTQSIAMYANNENIAANLRNVFPHPYTLADAEWYVNACAANSEEQQLCRAIVVNGEAVGSIGVFLKTDVYCKSAELGYWLGEPFWRQGIMSSAIRQLCSEAFKKFDIIRIFAEPYSHNIGSRKALEKAGFTLEGVLKNSVYKNGKVSDSCIYALLK
ncbi:GNAT family protein [Oscillospiraceae bacterium PP1C4]